MGILIQLLACICCIQAVLSHPMRNDGDHLYDEYQPRLAKKDGYHPFRSSLLTTLGFLEHHGKGGLQNQRKKAVDSTFIRFGRSSEPTLRDVNPHRTTSEDKMSAENTSRFIVDHNGCQISNSQELLLALMNDRNCIRAFPKVKREHVHDTFIRFGKRSVSSKELTASSEEV